MLALTALVVSAAPVRAQSSDEPDNAPVHLGPVGLSPAIRLTNVGRDTNVFNWSDQENPPGDFTATLSPAVDARLLLPRVRVNSHSEFNVYYFKKLHDLRAVDSDNSARLEFTLNRLTPFISGNLATTRHRQNLEIDARARRRADSSQVGVDIRLTAKASVGVYGRRSHVDYKADSLFRGIDLSRSLNHRGTGEGVVFRYALTPLTTVAVNAERQRDRFKFASERASDSVWVMPSVEFKPLALVSGRASVGFRKRTFLTGESPEFRGTVMRLDLEYTLLGQTQFGIQAQRELEYSYITEQQDYLYAGFGVFVTQRLGEAWDVVGRVGRYRLSYRQHGTPGPVLKTTLPGEIVVNSGGSLGYRFGRTRIGFDVDRYDRDSDLALVRGYERLRIGSSLTYVF